MIKHTFKHAVLLLLLITSHAFAEDAPQCTFDYYGNVCSVSVSNCRCYDHGMVFVTYKNHDGIIVDTNITEFDIADDAYINAYLNSHMSGYTANVGILWPNMIPYGQSFNVEQNMIMTPVEVASNNNNVLTQIATAKNCLVSSKNMFAGIQRKVVLDTVKIAERALVDFKDFDSYIINTDTIIDAYRNDIKIINTMFEEMNHVTKENFIHNITALDPETFDFLIDFFNINIDDYINEN